MTILLHQLYKLWSKTLVGGLQIMYLGVHRMCKYYREQHKNEKKDIGVNKYEDHQSISEPPEMP